ncbi:MAG: hypothetical protein QE280_12660 [Caulobacter sp.]|nr:hypothetical protein [Caulobacter sp.]
MRFLILLLAVSMSLPTAAVAGNFPSGELEAIQASTLGATQGKKPYTGNSFDAYVLSQDSVSYLVSYVGQERVNRIGPNGVTKSNRAYENGTSDLYIETQKVGYQVIRAGIASNNMDWIHRGLMALEWGLQPSVLGEDGSFPDQRETDTVIGRALHPKSIFLDSAAHAVLAIRQADVPQEMKDRAEALVPKLYLAVNEIVDSGDAAKFFKVVGNSSQLAFVAVAIHQVGLLADDESLRTLAQQQIQSIIDKQFEDGAFLERGGFDTSYQMNTLELTTAYNATLPAGEWRNRVALSNKSAADWFLSRVRPDGTVDTTGNTRQEPCGSTPGYFPKGLDIDNIPIRLLYYGYLSGRIQKILPAANKIQFAGVTYDHFGHCSNKVVD